MKSHTQDSTNTKHRQ